MSTAIEAKDLSRRYGNKYGVMGISFTVEAGTVYGFIGPNGAGKTTTISLLTGMLKPDSGTVNIMGKDLHSDRLNQKRRIGVVPDNPYVYDYMSAGEYLSFFADMYKVQNKDKRIDELLSFFNLSEHKDKPLKKYSKGMKQKVNIARGMIHDPDILFMDEPIQGLDPEGVKEVRDVILAEKKKGRTVFVSSHILAEMDRVCDRVGIINQGRLVYSGSVDGVKRSVKSGSVLVMELDHVPPGLVEAVKKLKGVTGVVKEGNVLTVDTARDVDRRKAVSKTVTDGGGIILSMKEEKSDLESAFVELIKEGA